MAALLLAGLGCGRLGFTTLTAGEDGSVGMGPNEDCVGGCAAVNAAVGCTTEGCELTCHLGFGDCDGAPDTGCETPLATGLANCGACNLACLNGHGDTRCEDGICQPRCEDGFGDCDADPSNGCEAALGTVAACGDCLDACENPHGATACHDGSCTPTCDDGFADCDGDPSNGCETNRLADPRHCGACGQACDLGTEICDSGVCAPSPCEPGLGECDGDTGLLCETDIAGSKDHCGFCGNACPDRNGTTVCDESRCAVTACEPEHGDCDDNGDNGCETNLASNPSHCGACERACENEHGTMLCSEGTCVPTCAVGYDSCDGVAENGCETALDDPRHCGACGNACPDGAGIATCEAGVCGVRCDISGTYSLRLYTPTFWYGAGIEDDSGWLHAWLRLEVVQTGADADVTVSTCGLDIPSVEMSLTTDRVKFAYPNALFDAGLPPATGRISLAGLQPGAGLSMPAVALVAGTPQAKAPTDAWPSDLTSVDDDGDGHPGVTALYESAGILDQPFTGPSVLSPRAARPYVAGRLAFSLAGALVGCDAAAGAATTLHLDTHVFGCELANGGQCSSSQAAFLDSSHPGLLFEAAWYEMVRVAEGANCEAIRSAL